MQFGWATSNVPELAEGIRACIRARVRARASEDARAREREHCLAEWPLERLRKSWCLKIYNFTDVR